MKVAVDSDDEGRDGGSGDGQEMLLLLLPGGDLCSTE